MEISWEIESMLLPCLLAFDYRPVFLSPIWGNGSKQSMQRLCIYVYGEDPLLPWDYPPSGWSLCPPRRPTPDTPGRTCRATPFVWFHGEGRNLPQMRREAWSRALRTTERRRTQGGEWGSVRVWRSWWRRRWAGDRESLEWKEHTLLFGDFRHLKLSRLEIRWSFRIWTAVFSWE